MPCRLKGFLSLDGYDFYNGNDVGILMQTAVTLASILVEGKQHWIKCYAPWHLGREAVERFVAESFAKMHGAQVKKFLPWLVILEDQKGVIKSVAGVRFAAVEPLFLEQYFELPIEKVLQQYTGKTVVRDGVVEVGNLAGDGNGFSRYLFVALSDVLSAWDLQWLVFTGTRRVRNTFKKFGLLPWDLGVADGDRLKGYATEWGSYYAQDPHVMAGPIASGVEALRDRQVYTAMGYVPVGMEYRNAI